MTGESAPLAAVAQGTCPYLGMVGDRNGHHSFPSRLHLCHAGEPAHIGLGFQAEYCLGGMYPSCARFQRAEDAAGALATGSGASSLAGTAAAAGLASSGATLDALLPPPPPPPPAGSVAVDASGTALLAVPAASPVGATASASFGRVRGDGEPVRSSRLVTALLGLALLSTLIAFAIAGGFLRLPGAGPVAVVTPAPITTATAAATSPAPTASVSATASPAPTPSAPPTATPAAGEINHVVQPGETLTSISLLYNVPIEAVVARNGITDPNSIQAGQTLIIPLGATAPPPTLAPTATPSSSGSPPQTVYVVQPGDTLSEIATEFDVTQQAILDANPEITDPSTIFVGQEIVIPAPP